MTKNLKTIVVYLACILMMMQSCQTTNNQYEPAMFTVIKDSLGKELTRQCSRPSPQDVEGCFKLSESDKKTLHHNFKKVYGLSPKQDAFKHLTIENLDEYMYQYVGVIIKNEKYIYINAFPEEIILKTNHDWKRIPLTGCDGGPHFWGVLFHIGKEKFTELAMNGPL
jgi:hypothetical protein